MVWLQRSRISICRCTPQSEVWFGSKPEHSLSHFFFVFFFRRGGLTGLLAAANLLAWSKVVHVELLSGICLKRLGSAHFPVDTETCVMLIISQVICLHVLFCFCFWVVG